MQPLVLPWREMDPDPVFGWGLRSDQPWIEHSVGAAGYEIRNDSFGRGYCLTWWHGNRGHGIGSPWPTIDAAKEAASKHLAAMVAGIHRQNSPISLRTQEADQPADARTHAGT